MFTASAVVLMLIAGAQTASHAPSSPPQPDAVSLERIRESLSKPPAVQVPHEVQLLVPEKKKTPTFRLRIEEEEPKPIWLDDPIVPLYVRTQRPAYHHEYLMLTTPEAFRAGTLYPGMDVLPALDAFFDSIGGELRERREQEERRKVRRELERFKVFAQ